MFSCCLGFILIEPGIGAEDDNNRQSSSTADANLFLPLETCMRAVPLPATQNAVTKREIPWTIHSL